jgi:hypothetical protein
MMIRRVVTTLLASLLVATSGNGQAWLLHAHDEHPWHAHAIDASGGLGPTGTSSRADDDHEHDESLPLDPSDEGTVVALKSGPAIARCGSGIEHAGRGFLSAILPPVWATTASSMTAGAQPWEQCAHTTASRAVESLLRSNHALLI